MPPYDYDEAREANVPMRAPAERVPEIEALMKRLDETIHKIAAGVDVLEIAVADVTTQALPAAKEEAKKQPPQTELGNKIARMGQLAEGIFERLNSLNERIEL